MTLTLTKVTLVSISFVAICYQSKTNFTRSHGTVEPMDAFNLNHWVQSNGLFSAHVCSIQNVFHNKINFITHWNGWLINFNDRLQKTICCLMIFSIKKKLYLIVQSVSSDAYHIGRYALRNTVIRLRISNSISCYIENMCRLDYYEKLRIYGLSFMLLDRAYERTENEWSWKHIKIRVPTPFQLINRKHWCNSRNTR